MQNVEKDPVGDFIREMEEKHDLLKYQVDGWCIWHYFRPVVGVDLLFKAEPLAPKKEIPAFERIKLAVMGIPSLLFPRKASYFAVTCSSDRSEFEGGKRKNIIFDKLFKELDSYFIVESANNASFLFPSKDVLVRSDMTSEILLLIAFILTKLYIPASIKRMAAELSQILQKEFELPQYTPTLVASWCMYFYWLKKLYAWLIRRVNPKIVLIGSGGASYIFAAAKEVGLNVVEFQHGLINRFNFMYSWPRYAVAYKKQLPIPDKIFLWSEFGKKELAMFEFWREDELIPVGSQRIDDYRNRREQLHGVSSQKCTILLTTATSSQMTNDFISEFLSLTRDGPDLELIIKTHPVYEVDGSFYTQAFGDDPRVRVILGNEQPSTFELLVQADIHLSVCSSCHYDAISLGTPTVILGLPCHEIFLPLHKEGHALLANTPRELYEIIRRFDTYKVPKEASEMYFKSGAFENIRTELKKVINS